MNSENFTVFLSMRNVVRKIVIDFDYYNESISAETEERTLETDDDLKREIAKFYEKSGTKSEKTIQRIIIPKRLMNAAVFGISEEGSTRSAKRLAWSKLLNVKQAYSASDAFSTVDLTDIDYIIISGGYDNSVNNRLNSMILSLGKNPQLLEIKPNIIFAGSRLSLETARKELAKPGIRFSAQPNVLENNSYAAADEELLQQNTISTLQQMTLWDEIEDVKINDIAYTEALRKISDVFCMKRSETVLSALFTDDYSLLSHAERGAGTTLFRNYAVPQEAGTLTTEVFESVFNDLLIEKQTVFDENFQQKNVLAIDDSVENILFEPDRTIGVTLTGKIDFEAFLSFVSIPGVTHGTIYFLFDDQGIILAGMTMFMQRKGGSNSFLRGFFNTTDIKNGWIFIPYGRFRKGAPAIFIEKLENDRKEDIVLKWGEYRVLEINPDSVVEIHTAKGVYMTKNDPESNKKTIGTKKSRKTLIFDLREEMHRWKQ